MASQHEALTQGERLLHDKSNILALESLITWLIVSLTVLIPFIDQHGIPMALPVVADELDPSDIISWAGTA